MSVASRKHHRWLRTLSCSRTNFDVAEMDKSGLDGDFAVDEQATLVVPGLGVGSWRLGLSLFQALRVIQRRMTADQRVRIELIGERCDLRITLPGNVTLEFNGESHVLQRVSIHWPWPRGGVFVQLQPRQLATITAARSEQVVPRPFRLCSHGEQLRVQDVLDFKFPVAKETCTAGRGSTELSRPELRFQGLSFLPCSRDDGACGSVTVASIGGNDITAATSASCSGGSAGGERDSGSEEQRLCGRRGTTPLSVSSIVERAAGSRCTGVQIDTLSPHPPPAHRASSHGDTTAGCSSTGDSAAAASPRHAGEANTIMLQFGESMQSVVASLGHPDQVFYCGPNGDPLHSWRVEAKRKQPPSFGRQSSRKQLLSQTAGASPSLAKKGTTCGKPMPAAVSSRKFVQQTSSSNSSSSSSTPAPSTAPTNAAKSKHTGASDRGTSAELICYNYFGLGLDVVFDPDTHTVCRLVLHTNSPCHPSFGQHSRCPFRLTATCCCSLMQSQHSAAKHLHTRSYITPATRWHDVIGKNACGCARVVGNVRYRGFSEKAPTRLDCLTHCAVMDQYLFEVLPDSSRDAQRLVSVTILPCAVDTACHGNYPGRSMKQVHEEFESKQLSLKKKAEKAAAIAELKFEIPNADGKPRRDKEVSKGNVKCTTAAGVDKEGGGSRATAAVKPTSLDTAPSSAAAAETSTLANDIATSPLATTPNKLEKKGKVLLTPRQTETSKLRQDKSHKTREESSSEQKTTSAKSKKTRSQTRLTPSARSTSRDKSGAQASSRKADTSATSPTHTADTSARPKQLKVRSSPGNTPSATSPSPILSPAADGSTSSDASVAQPGRNTLQEYAAAFRPNSTLHRSPPHSPHSPQLSGSPKLETGSIAKFLFPETLQQTSGDGQLDEVDGLAVAGHIRQQQQQQDKLQNWPATQPVTVVESHSTLAVTTHDTSTTGTTPTTPTTPAGGNTPSSNRRSWARQLSYDLKDSLSESLKEDDIRLESILHDHEDVADALLGRTELLRGCQAQWKSGTPHLALRTLLGTGASAADSHGEIVDSAALVNLVDICNREMSTSFSVDMSADILPAIEQLLGPQQRLAWTEVLCRYVSLMVQYVQHEVTQNSAKRQREVTLDRTVVGLRRKLVSLHTSLYESVNASSSPLSPLDSLPVAPAWRATLEEADSGERCKCSELLQQTLQHLSLLA